MKFPLSRRSTFLAFAVGTALYFSYAHFSDRPRVMAVEEVPLAFWAWRTEAPSAADLQKTFTITQADLLFQRAGQIDVTKGSIHRIRPLAGAFPSSVEMHLVYNGTRSLLREWESLSPDAVAEAVAKTYRQDLSQAAADNARVKGLQLDFDIPERLLPRYAEVLRRLRESLPPGTTLSVTGLPTWTNTEDIHLVLAEVDFWIPQCYGATVPTQLDRRIPISSPLDVERTIERVRRLDKPFYAGLSAYSYAILYAKDGSLLELRGDIDPARAAQDASLELVDTQVFKPGGRAGEIRYEYRATGDVVLDGLTIRDGETLVFDFPTSASLRESARAVRASAGEMLLGICIFRLPTADDLATLTVGEIAAALADAPTAADTLILPEVLENRQLKIHLKNVGTASTILGDDSLTIDLTIPPGGINGVTGLVGISAYETLCGGQGWEAARPCSPQRANVIRLKARSWRPGSTAAITLSFAVNLPAGLPVRVTTRVDDGRIEKEMDELQL